jgi:hypothetical protein
MRTKTARLTKSRPPQRHQWPFSHPLLSQYQLHKQEGSRSITMSIHWLNTESIRSCHPTIPKWFASNTVILHVPASEWPESWRPFFGSHWVWAVCWLIRMFSAPDVKRLSSIDLVNPLNLKSEIAIHVVADNIVLMWWCAHTSMLWRPSLFFFTTVILLHYSSGLWLRVGITTFTIVFLVLGLHCLFIS